LRATITGLAAALIAALVLVALPAPAGSRTPSPDATLDPALFQVLTVDTLASPGPTIAAAASPAAPEAIALEADAVLADPGAPTPEPPSRRVRVDQPGAPLRVLVKATPRPRITYSASGGGGWTYDPEVSWYGPGFYGGRTACGQAYTREILGVAHRTLPCGTKVTFRNPSNGRTITVPVIDRGPYVAGRQWDLSGGLCVYLDHCYTGPIQYRIGG
jgi:rare lipoprotein A (RlpA)-like double-psi beta-barrel protein